jgi:alkanesulfonate monooxygenase SsuD/methylene tetrahydromethanopterin reductase-like flavin-dependent oxidoreductase (luciferase family)
VLLGGGRLTVGVGASDSRDLREYTNMGKQDRFPDRGAYLDETIALWRHLWSGSTEPFTGRFHTLTDFVFDPLPAARERLPIWCGGRSARAVRRTAELCDGYHAAQTGPSDLAERLPMLRAEIERVGRPWPVVSTRARVKWDSEPGAVYALTGSADEMVGEVVRFAEVGNDELILVFDAATPDELAREVARFQHDVVLPAAGLVRASRR